MTGVVRRRVRDLPPRGATYHLAMDEADASAAALDGKRSRARLGMTLLALSFVPFLLSIGLAAATKENRDGLVWPIVVLYGISVVMWYAGLTIGGAALVARMRARRRSRRDVPTAEADDDGEP